MKTHLLHLLLVLLLTQISFGQKDEAVNKLTPDELKAVQEISAAFTKQLNETDDITPIFNELFIDDFLSGISKRKKGSCFRN